MRKRKWVEFTVLSNSDGQSWKSTETQKNFYSVRTWNTSTEPLTLLDLSRLYFCVVTICGGCGEKYPKTTIPKTEAIKFRNAINHNEGEFAASSWWLCYNFFARLSHHTFQSTVITKATVLPKDILAVYLLCISNDFSNVFQGRIEVTLVHAVDNHW